MQTPSPSPTIAIVTGGSRGLGKTTALHLAHQGHGVILTYKSSKAEADAVVAEIAAIGQQAVAIALNVSDSGSFDAFATQVRAALQTRWGRDTFQVLVNNAGTGVHAAL